jgi:hypothetical protein
MLVGAAVQLHGKKLTADGQLRALLIRPFISNEPFSSGFFAFAGRWPSCFDVSAAALLFTRRERRCQAPLTTSRPEPTPSPSTWAIANRGHYRLQRVLKPKPKPKSKPKPIDARFRRGSTMANRRKIWLYVGGFILCLAIFAVVIAIGIAILGSMKQSDKQSHHSHSSSSASSLTARKEHFESLAANDGLSPSTFDQNTCKKAVCLDYGKIDSQPAPHNYE